MGLRRGSTFVYSPGGVAGENVYTDWATMMAAVYLTPGDKWIKIDGTHAAATVPAGLWNVDNCTLTINGMYGGYDISGNTGTLNFADGAHLTFQNLIIQQLWVVTLGTTPVVQATPSMVLTLDLGASIFAGNATAAPFVEYSTSALPGASIFMRGGSTIGGGAGPGNLPIFQFDAGVTNTFLTLQDASYVAPGALSGPGSLLAYVSDDSEIFLPQTIVGLTQSYQSDASRMTYSATTAANWSGINPTSVTNALDRIAAKIGPIP
jgi:hypothetical protein